MPVMVDDKCVLYSHGRPYPLLYSLPSSTV
jgi:hypothetical protein